MIFVFLIGIRRIESGLWNIAVMTAYISCYTRVSLKTSKSAALFNSMTRSSVCWKRIKEQMHEIQDEPHVPQDISSVTCSIPVAYYDPSVPVLHDIHLHFEKGTITGITGRVACGKTLLAQILSGIREMQGCVMADGCPLSMYDVAYCTNRPQIFNDTIYHNITLGKDGDIHEVLQDVCLDHETDPVIWRGPVIAGVVKQFWTGVYWGELDYLIIDMPPSDSRQELLWQELCIPIDPYLCWMIRLLLWIQRRNSRFS